MAENKSYTITYSTEDEKVTIEFLDRTRAKSLFDILAKIPMDYFGGTPTTYACPGDDLIYQETIAEFHKGFKEKGISWLRGVAMTTDVCRWSDKSIQAGFRTRRDPLR